MLGLIYKDFKICKGTFFGMLAALLISNGYVLLPTVIGTDEYRNSMKEFPAMLVMMCTMSVLVSFYLSGMMQESLISGDERKKWAYFIVSTGDGIKRTVGSKYIIMVIYSMMTAFVCYFMNALVADIVGHDVPNTSGLIVVMFFVQLMIRAISAPFIIAFSSKYGNTVRLTAFFAVISIAFVYALFGDVSWIDLDGVWAKLTGLLADLCQSWKLLLGQVIFFTAVIAVYICSYKISCKLYLKGVEHYDK